MATRSFLVIAVALLLGGAAAWRMHNADAAIPQAKAPPRAVPVQTAESRRSDVPVSLTGLGVVQPLNVVTVRSRVDGAVVRIAFDEGQTVKEGDLLAQIDPRPYQAAFDQAKAKQTQDEAQLANAERDLSRYAQLAQSNFASRQQLDSQKAMVAQLNAQIDGDKAAVESAQVQLDYTTIKAPMAGRTGFRLVDKGNLVRATDATGIVTLSQITPITAVLTLPERNFAEVSGAMKKGEVPAIALTPDGHKLAQGTLTVLNSQIDQTTGTFKAKATFANADASLWPGQSVNVQVLVDTLKDVVTIPEDALQRSTDGYFAFVIKGDATAERRNIVVGRQARDVAVIEQGLDSGERVVVAGSSRLESGTHVDATEVKQGVADASPPAGRYGRRAVIGGGEGGVSGPFIKRPIATSLLMAAVLLSGLVAFPMLPVAPLPQIDFPTIQIRANLPGASPETMASSVAQPLERTFAQIPGVDQLTSVSALGATTIVAEFALDRDIDAAAQDIQAAINAASGQLPANLPAPPTYRKSNPADSPILLLSVRSDTLPITEVSDLADSQLAQQMSTIEGVGLVTIGGQQKPAVRVQIDPQKIASKGLTLEEIRGTMATVTVDSPNGTVDGPKRSFTIYANGQLADADKWNDVILAYRDGAPIRVRDVGRAVTGPEDTTQAAWINGKRGIFLVVFKQPGANVVDTVDKVKAELPRIIAGLPPAVKVDVMSDRTTTIRASLEDVEFTLALTIALVVAVIFVFLRRLWATIIPGLTVPLSLLGACGVMYVIGYSLDNLSLMALTIAVGFVVDDAIVMLENIVRHIEEGMKPLEAALKGAGEIGFTIVSISISLIAAFIPLLLMGGIIGRLFREFAMTVAITIAVSAFVSLTLTPMMAARFLKEEKKQKHGRLFMVVEHGFEGLLKAYGRGLDVVLRHQFPTLLVFFATIAAAVYLFMIIPKGFFPQQDTGLITGASEGAQDISSAEMAKRQQALDAIVLQDPAVATMGSLIGNGGGAAAPNAGRSFITLKPQAERDASADEIITRLRPKLAQVEGATLLLQSAQDVRMGGRRTRTQYQYTLQDSNLDELNDFAPKVQAAMKQLPELRDVASDQQMNGATLTVDIDRDQASRYGIQPQAIEDTLYDAFGQRQVAQYFTQLNSYHVILEAPPLQRGDAATLERLYVRSPNTGEQVPLSALAKWSTRETAPLTINHQGQFPAITLSFNLAPGVSLGQATTAIEQAQRKLQPPASLVGSFAGTAQAFQASIKTIPLLIVAALIAVYIILGMLYESYIHPLTILSTLPSAGVGALGVLYFFGFDFSLIALIGIVLLIGIVKKNGIMLVDFALAAERKGNVTPEEAIRQACLLRFRPILMTTMAAMLGGVPLMLGHGVGYELRQPLGYAMVGGLAVSQLLTLFTTPVVYLYLDRLALRLSGRRHEPEAQPAPAPAE